MLLVPHPPSPAEWGDDAFGQVAADQAKYRQPEPDSYVGRLDRRIVERPQPVPVVQLVLWREVVQVVLLVLGTVATARLVDAVVETVLADALAATIVEPAGRAEGAKGKKRLECAYRSECYLFGGGEMMSHR